MEIFESPIQYHNIYDENSAECINISLTKIVEKYTTKVRRFKIDFCDT